MIALDLAHNLLLFANLMEKCSAKKAKIVHFTNILAIFSMHYSDFHDPSLFRLCSVFFLEKSYLVTEKHI